MTCSSSTVRPSRRSRGPVPRTTSWVRGTSAGSKSSVYRFHLDSPIPFQQSLKATIEHGHANHRSDNYYSVAYWYQTEPHAPFPHLPPVDQRIPRIQPVGGPGNAAAVSAQK